MARDRGRVPDDPAAPARRVPGLLGAGNPAIVLPELFEAGDVESDLDATEWLQAYLELLTALNEQARTSEESAAWEFLEALADYANSYDLLVAMRVPLDEPFLVKIAERRDLSLTLFGNRGSQELVIADAQTNHVTFKIPDPNVRIRDFKAQRPGSEEDAFGAFNSRRDSQNRAFYAHDPDRDYRVRLSFKLGLLRRLQLVPYLVAGLLLLLVVALFIEQPTDLRTLALTVGPAALAASVLLAREPSTLGSRLRLASSLCLAGALLLLVGVSGTFYVSGHRGDQELPLPQRETGSTQMPTPTAPPSATASPDDSKPADADRPSARPSRASTTRVPAPTASVTTQK